MATSISTSIIACLKAFNAFVEQIQHLDNKDSANLLVQPWQDELGRLRMWAANIGAHQTNQSSLDYRLRDSSHIRQQIMNLLDELLNRLHEAGNAILADEADDDDIESLEGSSSEDEASQTDVHRLQRSVATIITCLFQMSMLVRKPAQHDHRVGSSAAEVAFFEPFDYNHVRDKYPKAEDFIMSRLGHGITRRRKYLKYRERHALKLKQGIAVDDNATSGIVLSETIATDVQDWNSKFDDNASQSGISQTSYAPTLMSGGDITIPAPPRGSRGGEPFECPYCYFIVTAPSTRSWNRHVFNDLQPYMCLDKTCNTPHKLYTTRHEWVHHARTMHHHEDSGESRDCILCGDPQETAQRYDRHVARHLQELALFVLPSNHDESDSEEPCADSDSGSSRVSFEPDLSPASPSGFAIRRSGKKKKMGKFYDDLKLVFDFHIPFTENQDEQMPETDAGDEFTDERAMEDIRGRLVQGHIVDDDVGSSVSSEETINDLGRRSATNVEGGEDNSELISDPAKEMPMNITVTEEKAAAKPYPRRGKTKIPRKLVNTEALTELGYSFEHEVSIYQQVLT